MKRIYGTWLKRQFEFEYCEECGGDAQHHTVIVVAGNPFARCDYPPSKETDWEQHPTIAAYRKIEDARQRVLYSGESA